MLKFSFLIISALLLSVSGIGNTAQNSNKIEPVLTKGNACQTFEPSTIYLNSTENVSIGQISIGSEVLINLGDIHLYRKIGSSGSVKYLNKQGHTLAKINVYDDAIKLKGEDGTLLYKVKLYDTKIKVAANDKMTNPIEIKTKHSKLFKVYKQDNEIGSVLFDDYKAHVKSGDSSMSAVGISANKISGIFAIDEIDITYRAIMVAELLLNFKR